MVLPRGASPFSQSPHTLPTRNVPMHRVTHQRAAHGWVSLCLQGWVNHDSDSHGGSAPRETMKFVCTPRSAEVSVVVGPPQRTALCHELCDHPHLKRPLPVL